MEQIDRPPAAAAPSLMSDGAGRSASSPHGPAHEPTRILASLEGRVVASSSPGRGRGRAFGIAAVALIVAGALITGLWAIEQARTRPDTDADLAALVPRSEPVPTSTRSTVPDVHAPAAEASPAAGGEAAAATIVNLPPPEVNRDAAQGAALPSSPANPAPSTGLAAAAPQSSARSNTDAAPRNAVAANHPSAHAASAARKNVEAPPVARPRDADVDLLAAMITHLNPPPPDPGAARNSPSAAPISPASVARNKANDVAPNIVQTTREQIAQCNSLGFFEAQLCRLRVCFGRIGKDSACSTEDVLPAASNSVSK